MRIWTLWGLHTHIYADRVGLNEMKDSPSASSSGGGRDPLRTSGREVLCVPQGHRIAGTGYQGDARASLRILFHRMGSGTLP